MSTDRAQQTPFFSIYEPGRRRGVPLRTRLLVIGGSLALALLAQALWPDSKTFRIVTPKGARAVTIGMTVAQVDSALGAPIGVEENGAASASAKCFRYGYPTFQSPSFQVHVACFEDGKLKSVTTKRYTAEKIDPSALPHPEPTPAAAPSGG